MNALAITVIMACHNRKEKTIACLKSLLEQAGNEIEIKVIAYDDASTDGTAEAILDTIPDSTIIRGDGDHYWGGGMSVAMAAAMDIQNDFILWLNDDVILLPDALSRMLSTYKTINYFSQKNNILAGVTKDPETHTITYGGYVRTSRWHPANLKLVESANCDFIECDTMNGNCVLIPREVAQSVGIVDPNFVHQLGDIDYGYRATAKGFRIYAVTNPVGFCKADKKMPMWRGNFSLTCRFRRTLSPLGYPIKPWFCFLKRHAGPVGYILALRMYIRITAKILIYHVTGYPREHS